MKNNIIEAMDQVARAHEFFGFAQFSAYLGNLITDLRTSGMSASADDFQTALDMLSAAAMAGERQK